MIIFQASIRPFTYLTIQVASRIKNGQHTFEDTRLFLHQKQLNLSYNSGSVVLDAKTGLVEGILVRGENDYVLDSARRCNIVNVCEEGKCRGDNHQTPK